MNRLGRVALVTVLVLGVVISISLTSCRRRGGDDGGGGAGGSAISTAAQGRQAASSSMQAASMVQGASTVFLNLASVGMSAAGAGTARLRTPGAFKAGPAMSRAARLTERLTISRAAKAASSAAMRATIPTTGTASCTDGGLTTWDMVFDDVTGEYTADMTFANCREDGSVLDGVYHMTATITGAGGVDLTITVGPSAPFTISDYSPGYGSLITKAVLSGFSLAIKTATVPDASSMSMTMAASGEMHVHDYLSLEDYELAFSNGYACAAVISLPAGAMVSLSAKGEFSETWADASGSNSAVVSFRDLKLDTAATDAYEDTVISGAFSVTYTPASCLNGAFVLKTTAPIRYDLNAGHSVSGEVTVDGVTAAAFNADGTVTVTTGAEGVTYGSLYEWTGSVRSRRWTSPRRFPVGLPGPLRRRTPP